MNNPLVLIGAAAIPALVGNCDFFAFVLSFPISYLLAKSEAMSLVLGRAHSIPGVIKIRGMSAITIDKAYKSIHMFYLSERISS